MVLPKKAAERESRGMEVRGRLYQKNKNAIHQLGHFNKATRQKIGSKKKNLQITQGKGKGKKGWFLTHLCSTVEIN